MGAKPIPEIGTVQPAGWIPRLNEPSFEAKDSRYCMYIPSSIARSPVPVTTVPLGTVRVEGAVSEPQPFAVRPL